MKNLFVSVLVLTILSTGQSLDLKNLCKFDTFLVNLQFLRVNSYHKLNLEYKTPNIGFFYISQDLGVGNDLPVKTIANLTEIRTQYNKLLLKIYSNKFMSELKFSEEVFKVIKQFNDLETQLKELKVKKSIDQQRLKLVQKSFLQSFNKIRPFMKSLVNLRSNRLPLSFINEEQLLNEFETNPELINFDNTKYIPVFGEHFLELYFTRQITKLENFTLHKKSSMFFNPNTFGVFQFSLWIPFENKLWDFSSPNFQCTKKEDLTPFYQKKERLDDLLK